MKERRWNFCTLMIRRDGRPCWFLSIGFEGLDTSFRELHVPKSRIFSSVFSLLSFLLSDSKSLLMRTAICISWNSLLSRHYVAADEMSPQWLRFRNATVGGSGNISANFWSDWIDGNLESDGCHSLTNISCGSFFGLSLSRSKSFRFRNDISSIVFERDFESYPRFMRNFLLMS